MSTIQRSQLGQLSLCWAAPAVARSPICVFKLKVEGRQVIKDQSNHMSASRQERIVVPLTYIKVRTNSFITLGPSWVNFCGETIKRTVQCSLFKSTVGNELATTARSWQLPLIYFIQRNTAKFRNLF